MISGRQLSGNSLGKACDVDKVTEQSTSVAEIRWMCETTGKDRVRIEWGVRV